MSPQGSRVVTRARRHASRGAARIRATLWRARGIVRYARKRPAVALTRLVMLASLTASALFFALPLYWLFTAAFDPGSIGYPPRLIPRGLSAAKFFALLRETQFPVYLANSLIVSAATVIVAVVAATLAGYVLSQYEFRHQQALMLSLLVVQLVPIVALIVPLFRLFALANLLNTLAVVALADVMLVVPVATWLIKGYFDTVPDTLTEAARAGGASRTRAFLVVVPLVRPAIGVTALYAFVVSWNQFIIPLTFTTSRATWTFPVGLYGFVSQYGVVDWGMLGAASVLGMLPVLALFIAFQRQFLTGLEDGLGGGSP